ncbi:MAG TPA: DUF58 domain-containing protein [Roseiflexaceae bacterium]|nr:DUF58 domain-containing protein [Roseiflexaceae bacterium]
MQRAFVLGALVYGLVLLGLASVRGEIIALALPLVVYLAAGLLEPPAMPVLRATRRLSADRASPGAPVTVTLSVTNEGAHAVDVLLADRLPRGLHVEDGELALRALLAAGATADLRYTVSGRRGLYTFGDITATASDMLGLFRKRAHVSAPGQLFVVPEVPRLRRVNLRPRNTQMYAGTVPARQGGPGIEFFGVREYQPGDSMRWINGRATARHAEALFVNEFEQERVAEVVIILDARQRCDVQTPSGSLFEHAVQATAALADVLLTHGNRVGVLAYGGALNWTFPGYGKVQRERILQALARAQPGDLPIFESFDFLPTQMFPPRAQLILISPLLPNDAAALRKLRARGYALLVMSPNPVAFEQQDLAATPEVALAARIAQVERALLLRQCRAAGIPLIDWPVDVPLQQIVTTALGQAAHLFRALGGLR